MCISKPTSKTQGIEKAALGAMGNLSQLRAKTAARNNTVGNRVGDVVTDAGALAELAAERRIGR